MVTDLVVFTAVPGGEDAPGRAIAAGVPRLRRHPGCVAASLSRGLAEPGRFTVAVTWAAGAARSAPVLRCWTGAFAELFDPATLAITR